MSTHRVQMDLSESAFQRLGSLKQKIDANSYTEVMKEALRLYEWLLSKEMSGARFFIEEMGKDSCEVKLFLNSPA
jgi:hypothetical protein